MDLYEGHLAKPKKDHLYHYTSHAALHGMVKSNVLWASVIHYLNDAEEFSYAISLAQKSLNKIADSEQNTLLSNFLLTLSDSIERIQERHVYVFSLTERRDLLSQWRGYCPPTGGYSIGFQTDLLEQHLKKIGAKLAPCIYQLNEQTKFIREVIDTSIASFNDKVASEKDLKRLKPELINEFFQNFSKIGPFIKHPSFSEEKEWRIVRDAIGSDSPRMDYRVGPTMIIPTLHICIKDPFPIKKLVIGPSPHQRIIQNATGFFLHKEKVKYNEIRPSEIPFRVI